MYYSTVFMKLIGMALGTPAHAIFNDVVQIAINSLIYGLLAVSIYGMYWDEEREVVLINYVPGWAYMWFLVVDALVILLALTSGCALFLRFKCCEAISKVLLTAVVLVSFYVVFTCLIPMIMYQWSFCWIFVDRVAAATPSASTPFDVGAMQSLASAFDDLVYTCVPCFFVAFLGGMIARVNAPPVQVDALDMI